MNARGLILRFSAIQVLAWVQRFLRIGLRLAWLGLGGHLLYWGVCRLAGWDQNLIVELSGATVMALAALFAIFFPWPFFSHLAWKIDQGLKLKEQATTAWQVIQMRESGRVAPLLLIDTAMILGKVWWRIALRGWNLTNDLVSLFIVILLSLAVIQVRDISPNLPVSVQEQAQIPPLGQDAKIGDIFPSGIPGLKASASENQKPEGSKFTSDQMSGLNGVLDELGDTLSQMATTRGLGQALQQQDYGSASQKVEDLAGIFPSLSKESRSQISEAFEKASQQLNEAGMQPLASDMGQAAEQAKGDKLQDASAALDNLANSLHILSENITEQVGSQQSNQGDMNMNGGSDGAGLGSGPRETGEGETFDRLQGDNGQTIQFDASSDHGGLLTPGNTGQEGEEIVSGQYSSTNAQNINNLNNYLSPYHYIWVWRNVVSKYFSK